MGGSYREIQGSPKRGVCPAQTSSHTVPAHHPGHLLPTSDSPRPDARGRGQPATPGRPASTQPRRRRSPPLWRAPAFTSSANTSPVGVLHGGGQEALHTLGGTPGLVVEAAPLRPLCQSPSRQRAGRSKGALLSLWPAYRARRRAHVSLVHHQDTRRQAESAASNCSTPRSPAPFKHPLHRIIRHAHRPALSRRRMLRALLGRDAR